MARNQITRKLKRKRTKNIKKGNARQLEANPDPPPIQSRAPITSYDEDRTDIADEETNHEAYEDSNESSYDGQNDGEPDENGPESDLDADAEASGDEIDGESSTATEEST